MEPTDYIVHRANSAVNTTTAREQVAYFAMHGFTRLEIDIYAISEKAYKFCHPLDAAHVHDIHTLDDGYLLSLVEEFPHITWLVDLKCLDLPKAPESMLRMLVDTFGKSAMFIASQKEILEYAYSLGSRTVRYFRDDTTPLSFEPDFHIYDAPFEPIENSETVIIYCSTFDQALPYQTKGFTNIMLDANLFISSQAKV